MSKRLMNFNPGPAALPLEALEEAQRELLNFGDTGLSILEHSHRADAYLEVHAEAQRLLRTLMAIPDDYEVLFLQGGARHQFAMIPMNLLSKDGSADYVVTGVWGAQALSEASRIGTARLAGTTEAHDFCRVPTQAELSLDPRAAYLHLTSNNTLYGTQWATYPEAGSVPLVADMTSDMLCRDLDVSRFGMLYAGAQKNLGPAGVTVVVVRKSWIENAAPQIPEVLRYHAHASKDSMWNTPPTFSIYLMRNTLRCFEQMGGLSVIEKCNRAKAAKVYGVIDRYPEFYRSKTDRACRSIMNAVFRLPSEALEAQFLIDAKAADLHGLKGHRRVGGLRVSMYNAVPMAWIDVLEEFMLDFAKRHGSVA